VAENHVTDPTLPPPVSAATWNLLDIHPELHSVQKPRILTSQAESTTTSQITAYSAAVVLTSSLQGYADVILLCSRVRRGMCAVMLLRSSRVIGDFIMANPDPLLDVGATFQRELWRCGDLLGEVFF
jgi:hypothetical protein